MNRTRIQRCNDETTLYVWNEEDKTWDKKFTMVGDFDLELPIISVKSLEVAEPMTIIEESGYTPQCVHYLRPGYRNIYCYNCSFDRRCPYEGR